jgi:hypothetical protein
MISPSTHTKSYIKIRVANPKYHNHNSIDIGVEVEKKRKITSIYKYWYEHKPVDHALITVFRDASIEVLHHQP